MRRPAPHWIVLVISAFCCVAVPWQLLSQDAEHAAELGNETITQVKIDTPEDVAALIEKPLFNPERKRVLSSPDGGTDPEAGADGQPPSETAPPPNPPKLVGIAKGGGKAIAIVKGPDGTAQNLKPGEDIDGWRLLSIARTSATFINSGTKTTLSLGYDNKAIGGPADPAKPSPKSRNIGKQLAGESTPN